MKKILFSIILLVSISAFAQLPNQGFDVWVTDTAVFGYAPFVQEDTFAYNKPQGWYSVNAITKNKYIGGKSLVEETNALALFGSASAKLVTDSIFVAAANLSLNIPGFMVNGNFKISLADLLLNNTNLSPSAIPGAGTPISTRKQKLQAYVQYQPIPNDSLLIWAVLKKKDTIIAEAKIAYKQATANTILLEKDFTYTSCSIPDTVVVMIASSTPDFSTALGGSTGIDAGSVLIVDSVKLIDFNQGFVFPPFANRDQTFTYRNTPKTIDVLANDYDCANTPVNITNVGTPLKGAAVLNGTQIVYTPNSNYVGVDSFEYTISNANGTAKAYVLVSVFSASSISEVSNLHAIVFPNPTTAILNIAADEIITNAALISLEGEIIEEISSNNLNQIQMNVENLPKGIYFVKISGSKNDVIKRIAIY